MLGVKSTVFSSTIYRGRSIKVSKKFDIKLLNWKNKAFEWNTEKVSSYHPTWPDPPMIAHIQASYVTVRCICTHSVRPAVSLHTWTLNVLLLLLLYIMQCFISELACYWFDWGVCFDTLCFPPFLKPQTLLVGHLHFQRLFRNYSQLSGRQNCWFTSTC